jgi:hypothetical protein
LSAAVEKISLFFVGMVVLRGMSGRHHAAKRLDTERERRDVEQEEVLDLARQDATLERRANGDHFIRVDSLVRLLAEQFLDHLLHARHARGAADEHHLVDVLRLQAGIGQRLRHGTDRALHQRLDQLLQRRPRPSFIVRCLGPVASP